MANKTFIKGVTGKGITNLADNLRKEYEKLCQRILPVFNHQCMVDKKYIWLFERDRYNPSNKGDKVKTGYNHLLIPLFEISNKMHDNSPILFVGMNPSGADIEHYDDYNSDFMSIPHDVFIYDGKSPYYETMRKFAFECLKGIDKSINEDDNKGEKAEGKYSEIDIFGIVQSTQAVVQKDFLANPDNYIEMFDLFLKYTAKIKPKVIIVANALVRKILKRDRDLNLDDNNKYGKFYNNDRSQKFELVKNETFGGYTFSIGDFNTQLYFSSMLSGQRALDKGSGENLVWLIRNYLKNTP